MKPLILSPEQTAILQKLQAFEAELGKDVGRLDHPATAPAIDSLIEEAYVAGLPDQAYAGLRRYYSMIQSNEALPPHLRQKFEDLKK